MIHAFEHPRDPYNKIQLENNGIIRDHLKTYPVFKNKHMVFFGAMLQYNLTIN